MEDKAEMISSEHTHNGDIISTLSSTDIISLGIRCVYKAAMNSQLALFI